MVIRVLPLSLNHNISIWELDLGTQFGNPQWGDEPDRFDEESINPFDIIWEGFMGDWRQGQEIKQVFITKRFYQVSSSSSEA